MSQAKFNDSKGDASFIAGDNQKQFLHLEGECRIQNIQPLKRLPLWRLIPTVIFFLLASIMVIGLLILRYSKKFRSRLLYSQCQYEQATQVFITGNDSTTEIQDTFVMPNGKKAFVYRKMKYCHDNSVYHPIGYNIRTAGHIFNQSFYSTGLNEDEVLTQREYMGRCEHKVEIPTYFQYIGNQFIKPFFILQYVVCVSYILEKNYQFAIIMLVLSFITTSINYILLYVSFKKIKQIAEHSAIVDVIRNGQKIQLDSTQLVPGDLFSPQELIPCDCVLISGEIYVNEASLTGENVPIGKFPAVSMANLNEDNCWLFEGAKILELRGIPIALVVNTGFASRKGRIFRKILHNNPSLPQFFGSAIKFLAIMLAVVFVIYFCFLKLMIQRKYLSTMIFYRGLDMIGWGAPAAFPIYFNLCYSLGLARLRRSKIYGTQPQKTIVAGKIKTMCFDKTGTLTQNKMELYNINRIRDQNTLQQIVVSEVNGIDPRDIMIKLFASCHTVRNIQGEFMGDELDLRMFLFSGFSFELSQDVNIRSTNRRDGSHIDVLRINQYESKFQCMSVLVRDVAENKFYAFVKGAAEKIQRCSLNRYNKYEELISSLSLAGLRNIAIGYKEIQPSEIPNYLTCKRQEFEKGLTLLGVVAFENKLKDDAVKTLAKLMAAHIEPKIITGDSIFIGVETAMRAGILHHGSKVLLFEGRKQQGLPGMYNGILLTHDRIKSTSQPITMSHIEYCNQMLPIGIDNDFLNLSPTPQLPSTIKLFARISPQSKATVVRRLIEKNRAINLNWKVGMCGDGANDLMAIKQADAGMGISETDSAFAANFSIPELKGVEHIIRDGKATLSNIRDIFIFYGATSFVKATSSFILMYDSSYLSPNQITFYNYSSNLILVLLLAFSVPADRLTSLIPNDNFMGLENALTYIGNFFIPTAGLILCEYFAWTQPFFQPTTINRFEWNYSGYTNTIVLLCMELILVGVLFGIYVAHPFKKPICYNIPLTILLTIDVAFYIALFFVTRKNFMGLVSLEIAFAGKLLGIALGTIALTVAYSYIIRIIFRKNQEKYLDGEPNMSILNHNIQQ